MKKIITIVVLTGLVLFAACTKSTDPAPAPTSTGDPKKGSQWTFRYTSYSEAGAVLGSIDRSFVADTATLNGTFTILLKETLSGQITLGIQKRTDGWWWIPFPNPNASLWCKYPAVVGDQFSLNNSDYTVDVSKVMSINSSVTVPAGTFANTYFIQMIATNNTLDDERYFTSTGPILVRSGTFDPKTPPATGMYEKQRSELVSYTQ